jgi:hypothetical protein
VPSAPGEHKRALLRRHSHQRAQQAACGRCAGVRAVRRPRGGAVPAALGMRTKRRARTTRFPPRKWRAALPRCVGVCAQRLRGGSRRARLCADADYGADYGRTMDDTPLSHPWLGVQEAHSTMRYCNIGGPYMMWVHFAEVLSAPAPSLPQPARALTPDPKAVFNTSTPQHRRAESVQ